MTAIDWDTAHTDVVCPPYAGAVCTCGSALGDHASVTDIFTGRPIELQQCPEPEPTADRLRLVPAYFDLAAGENLDCPESGADPVCGVELCAEHSSEFTTCAGFSGVLHHWACRHRCPTCADAGLDDARSRA